MEESLGAFDERAYQNRISVHSALKQRGRHRSNIWVFDSPKINRRFVIHGEVAFMHIVLLEGDPAVSHYDPDPPPVFASVDGETRKTTLDLIVYFRNGREEWWEFKRAKDAGTNRQGRSKEQLIAQAQAANDAGVPYLIKTELNFTGKEILFENWLVLCSIITRAQGHSDFKERLRLMQMLDSYGEISIESVLADESIDRGLMLSAIARALQSGEIMTNLDSAFFCLDSTLKRAAP